MATDRRETACYYLRDGADVLLLDAGSGMRRLVTEPALLDGVERLYVALSHFHLDHVNGLITLPALQRLETREVWAPGRVVAGMPAEDVIAALLGPPFLAATAAEALGTFVTGVRELDGTVEIGPFTVETRVQPKHTCPTVAMRVNGELAYCTDTAYDPENAAFARGVAVLLHEAYHAADETDDPIHSAAGEAARIAAAAEVERLVICHADPKLADDEELVRFARPHFEAVEVGRDGAVL
jgi:ribonuclease BN (tRNA processing enzyme)